MFFEITGSRSVLANFTGKKSLIASIDYIYPDTTKDSINIVQNQNNRTIDEVSVLSENDNYLPYKYVVKEKFRKQKSLDRIRNSSVTPVSIESSANEIEYDIIRDDVGHTRLVGKVFYQSLRSNSSKYVSEASKFKSPSEFNSSKWVESARDEMFSARFNNLAAFKLQEKEATFDGINTLTDGFLKSQNFLFSPKNRELPSLNINHQFKR